MIEYAARKMAAFIMGGKTLKEKHEMINLTANVVGEVKRGSFEQKGEQISVTNFSLVHTEGEKKRYTSCSAYGRFSEDRKSVV